MQVGRCRVAAAQNGRHVAQLGGASRPLPHVGRPVARGRPRCRNVMRHARPEMLRRSEIRFNATSGRFVRTQIPWLDYLLRLLSFLVRVLPRSSGLAVRPGPPRALDVRQRRDMRHRAMTSGHDRRWGSSCSSGLTRSSNRRRYQVSPPHTARPPPPLRAAPQPGPSPFMLSARASRTPRVHA